MNADIGAKYGDVRPLDRARRRALKSNRVHLLDNIDSDVSFVAELGSVGCITWSQREYLDNIQQPRDRNVKLLEFLARRSDADFHKFTRILAKQQAHLVTMLVTDGGEISCVCRLYL